MRYLPNYTATLCVGYFVLLSIILHIFTRDYNISIKGDKTRAESKLRGYMSENIIHCVPHHKLLIRHRLLHTGNRNQTATALSLTSAYDYEMYSVVTIQADGWFGRTTYCRYLDVNRHEIYPPIESFVFPEFTVHCCSRNSAYFLSVTRKPNDIITEYVTILDRRKDEPKYFLSICLAPMYGNETKWLLLAELVEHYRLQGVDHIYIYVKDMDDYTFKLIKHYEKKGIAEITRFRDYNDRPGQEWQLVGVQDCLQRSRHHSRYVIFQDLDERIIPTGNVTVKSLIRETMELNNSIAMIAFNGERVERTFPVPAKYRGSDATLKHHLPTLVFHKTVINRGNPKCAIDPRKVLLMWVHHVELYFQGYGGYSLSAEKAIFRNYRDITHANLTRRLRPIKRWFMYSDTSYPAKMMSLLYRNVEAVLNRAYGNSIIKK